MTPRLIVFDVDGTLIDSQVAIVAAMTRAFAEAGEPVPAREEILAIVGLSLDRAVAAIAPHLPQPRVLEIAEGYRRAFVDARSRAAAESAAPLYPHAREVLGALRAEPRTLLGTATGKARRGLQHMIETHDLHGVFTTLQCADDHPSKPHPSMLEAAMRETGVEPERTVMIGDTSFDMEMARAAGAIPLGVAWGYHDRDRLARAGAVEIANDFIELKRILERLA